MNIINSRSAKPWLLIAAAATVVAAWLPLIPSLRSLFTLNAFYDLSDPRLANLFGRTVWMSACSAMLSAICGLPLALLAHRIRIIGGNWCALLLPLPLLLPPLLLAQAWHGLLGIDGPWASVFCLGLACAPFPALLASRALLRQSISSHNAALLSGGPRLAISQMWRGALPATALGTVLAFLFIISDFAVPDYFAAVGDKFSVYAAEVFNGWRSEQLEVGASAAAPLVLLAAVALYLCFALNDRISGIENANANNPTPLQLSHSKSLASILAWLLLGLLLLAPLARIFFETGAAGPNADGDWWSRSMTSFQHGLERGRSDLLRSMRTGIVAAGICLLLAPVWAEFLNNLKRGRIRRVLQVVIALPLLTPAVGTGLGTILIWNSPQTSALYDAWFLPPLIMAGRFLPIAVFVLLERLEQSPLSQKKAALISGVPYLKRLFQLQLGPHRAAWFLSAGLVAIFSIRELDLAVLIPAANPSAAVRYYNALHFARDGFVAAFGLMIAIILFLPVAFHALWQSLHSNKS